MSPVTILAFYPCLSQDNLVQRFDERNKRCLYILARCVCVSVCVCLRRRRKGRRTTTTTRRSLGSTLSLVKGAGEGGSRIGKNICQPQHQQGASIYNSQRTQSSSVNYQTIQLESERARICFVKENIQMAK